MPSERIGSLPSNVGVTKMKNFFYCLSVLFFAMRSLSGFALEVKFLGKSAKPIAKVDVQILAGQTAGQVTFRTLTDLQAQGKLKFIGSEASVESINELSTHQEFVDATHLRVYGWCYQVDGKIPDVIAGEFTLTSSQRKLLWYFAYATFDTSLGQWTEGCKPVATLDDEGHEDSAGNN